jgi:tRNA pseudouridine38-40 synthase
VTASFDARSQCDSRLYEYILPEWVFDPDLKLISTKEGPQEEPADAPAAPPGHFGELNVEKAAGVPSENGGVHHRKARSRIGPPIASNRSFTFEEGCCARLTGILKQFEGTHNFHNFSPNVCPEQMSAQRCDPCLPSLGEHHVAVCLRKSARPFGLLGIHRAM